MNREPVAEQLRYYRARASEYEMWFERLGRYDLGSEENARWFEEVDEARKALDNQGPVDAALELACGTGLWTSQLLPMTITLTAVDAAPEMLALNRERVASDRVEYIEADLFDWEPDRRYDLIFFGY
ncbi:MAG: class I SAM-dependent methyltransferase [Actinomycetota bacterium]|nr:class I SAM-dependent methyltransferase [Actinomycetota bacterium]